MCDILFLSPMCLLDQGSGAAISVRSWLEWLAEAGYSCRTLTLSVFDGPHEYPLQTLFNPAVLGPHNHAKLLRLEDAGIEHNVYYTRSTVGSQVGADEQRRFLEVAQRYLHHHRPRMVISYGSSDYTAKLLKLARYHCDQLLFYLANGELNRNDLFESDDLVVCPSRFLADHYHKTMGLTPRVLRSAILPHTFIAPERGIAGNPAGRGAGLITFINPQPAKGLTLVRRLVQLAWLERPEFQFLIVEGRITRAMLQNHPCEIPDLPNLWWMPKQKQIWRVYARTSVLLFPSYWQEAAGRVAAEAMLSGIPVLAANRGGISEQLNGGGTLFEIPENCIADYCQTPADEAVRPWLTALSQLMDNEECYRRASQRALAAGAIYSPQRRKQEVVDFFAGICRGSEPLQNKKVDYGKHNGKDINNRFDEFWDNVEQR